MQQPPHDDEQLRESADFPLPEGGDEADDTLQMLGQRLAARRNEWVSARAAAGVDERFAEAAEQYNGKERGSGPSNMMDSVAAGYPATHRTQTATRSTIFVQVTRQKTNAAAARLGDILLPTDERNFGLLPTTLPTLSASVLGELEKAAVPPAAQPGQPPQPLSPQTQAAQAAMAEYAEAKKRSDAMQKEIADAFEECDYQAETRKVIFDAALYGTGVLKGPVVVNRTRRAWSKRVDAAGAVTWVLETVKELKPASFRIAPQMVFPDPLCGEDVQRGRGVFELDKLSPRLVRDLVDQPGYLEEQIKQVLEEGPQAGRTTVGEGMEPLVPDDVFEKWVYTGEIDREDLIACGCKVPEDDTLRSFSACVEMINSTVVRAYLNPLADGKLPYDFFSWERVAGSVWGYGVPYLMRSQQRVINAAWRMVLDNAGVSSGPQIVITPGLIQPADKQWTITPRKVWYAQDGVEDVRKAFATFEFNSHQAELANIIEMAEKISDQETAVPMITQGERGSAPETVGGMQMLLNSSNVMLRRLVKNFDDCITKPQVRAYYGFLMEYSEKQDIKGDFQVVALGSSSLVVRDIQNQAYTQLLALGGNPVYAPLINQKKLFEKALRAQHIDPTDVMNTDQEIAQLRQQAAQNQQKDPRVAAAEFRASADMKRTEAQVIMNRETLETKLEAAELDAATREAVARMNFQAEMMRLAQDESLTLEQIKAQLAGVSIKERNKGDMQAAEIQLAAAKGEGI